MAIGVSVVLIALGAVLTWGTRADVSGVPLSTVGVVLMIFGAVVMVATVIHAPGRMPGPHDGRLPADRSPDPQETLRRV